MQNKNGVGLIGAPFDLCGLRVGSRLGPAALRIAGLSETLTDLGLNVRDLGDVCGNAGMLEGRTAPGGMTNFEPLRDGIVRIREVVQAALEAETLPILLGGDHALAMGSVAAALQHYGADLGVLWIDAHADVNTPGSSATGNIHGMPLAALAQLPSGVDGVRDAEWRAVSTAVRADVPLPLAKTAWFALRDVDAGEVPQVRKGLGISMHEIDRYGVVETWQRTYRWLSELGIRKLWISFDVDAMDPMLAPGTGTAVRGGLTYREAHLLAELIYESLSEGQMSLAGLDVVETNPLIDSGNQTAIVAVEWVASLFGKTILRA